MSAKRDAVPESLNQDRISGAANGVGTDVSRSAPSGYASRVICRDRVTQAIVSVEIVQCVAGSEVIIRMAGTARCLDISGLSVSLRAKPGGI